MEIIISEGSVEEVNLLFISFQLASVAVPEMNENNGVIVRIEIIELGEVNLVLISVPSARVSQCSSCRAELIVLEYMSRFPGCMPPAGLNFLSKDIPSTL
jgi:hypothetical protein